MNSSKHSITTILASGCLCLLLLTACQPEQESAPEQDPAPKQDAAAQEQDPAPGAQSTQRVFDTPEQAAESLVAATATFDVSALKQILGPDCDVIISSNDPVMDKEHALEFAAAAKEKQVIEIDPGNPDHAFLTVGENAFPLPIPVVKKDGKWSFDTAAGTEEILHRRIGANELDAIAICHGFVETQHDYAQTKHDGAKVNQYAQRIISSPGKRDGLAWKNEDGTWAGPVGVEIASALEQGYTEKGKSQPFHGYHFKVLKGQGPAAPMGQLDFVINGAMIGGFALAAAPAEHGVTGVKTFIVSHTGIVYEQDLGPDTLDIFAKMELFNPDESWEPTEDEW